MSRPPPRVEARTQRADPVPFVDRWFCQVCEKQCRDENGFKCHTMTEGHLRQMLVVGESAGKHIKDYSSQFQGEFVGLMSRRQVYLGVCSAGVSES